MNRWERYLMELHHAAKLEARGKLAEAVGALDFAKRLVDDRDERFYLVRWRERLRSAVDSKGE